MRYISKHPEPESFRRWKSLSNDEWQPTYKTLQNPEKAILHASLIAEQEGICCYCQGLVETNNSHIEHLLPQNLHPNKALDYENLLCSCGHPRKSKSIPDHCGHAKRNKELPITPLHPDCCSHFLYSSDGSIKPNPPDNKQAKDTIEILKLDSTELTKSRKFAIDALIDDSGIDDWEEYMLAFLADKPVAYISWLKSLLNLDPQ